MTASEQYEFDVTCEYLDAMLTPGLPQAINSRWLSEHVAGALRKNKELAEVLLRASAQ